MSDYQTIDMVVRSLLGDILRTDVPPAGTLGFGFIDDNGALVSVPLSDLSSPAATAGTGLTTAATEPAAAAGAQTITVASATWFGDVGIVTAGGKSIPLSFGTGYTFTAGVLTVLAVAGVQVGDVITYAYASGAVSGQQPAPVYTAGAGIAISPINEISAPLLAVLEPLSYPVMVALGADYVGYDSLEDVAADTAANFKPVVVNAPYLTVSQNITLTGSLYSQSLTRIQVDTGVTLTLTVGMRLHNIQFLRNNASTAKVAIVSTQGAGVALDASQGVQLVDSRIGPDLVFGAVGHVITARGRGAIDNAIGSPGTIYLYDTATATIAPGGPTLVDRRPGAANGGGTYTAGTGVDLNGTQFSSTRLELAEPITGSYTLRLADAGKLVPFTNTAPAVLTFPANADVALPVGTIGYVRRQNTGALSLAAAAGVQLLPPGIGLNIDDYAKVSYHKIDLNTYWLEGSLS